MNTFYWQHQDLWGKGRQPARWEAEIIDSVLEELEPLTRDDEEKLLELSDRLSKQFLDRVSEGSLKNSFTRLHKAIKIHFSPDSGRLTEANSILHPTTKELTHIALLLVDTPQEIKDKTSESHGEALEWKHNNVAYLDNPGAIIDKGRELLEKAIEDHKTGAFCNYRDLAAALCLLAGLRPVEALRDAVLEPKTQFTLIMADGQAKTRGEERVYEMPTLIEADLVLEGYRILREIFDASTLNDNEIQKFKNGVRDHVIANFKNLVPTLQRLKGEKQVNTQRLRAVYDAIAVFYYCPPKVKDFVYVKVINGHKPQKGRSDAAMHYLDYQIADEVVAKHNGKRQGIKLGEPGVEVLERFKDKVSTKSTAKASEPIVESDPGKRVRLWAATRDRDRLNELGKKLDTPNHPMTIEKIIDLAQITLSLAEKLNIEPTLEAFNAAIPTMTESPAPTLEPQQTSMSQSQSNEIASIWEAITHLAEKLDKQSALIESANFRKQTTPKTIASNSPGIKTQPDKQVQIPQGLRQGESEAKINTYIDAIIKFNNSLPDDRQKEKWFIGISALKRLVTANQNVIQRVLNERAEEIAKHHTHHQLTEKHNSKGRFAPKINEVVGL